MPATPRASSFRSPYARAIRELPRRGCKHHRPPQQRKRPKADEESFHKGWRVTGVPPGALEAAQIAHQKKSRLELQNGKQPKDFIDADWLRNAKQKPVRAKPYSIPDAAEACAELARKAGWLQVTVTPIEKILPKETAK